MMTYLALNTLFLAAVGVLAWNRRHAWSGRIGYICKMTAGLLLLTLVFDNIIILLDIVRYNSEHVSGLYLYKAPIEDFAYTIGAVLLIVSLWKDES